MPEITPDLTDQYRCISVHWSLPIQCVLPCTHRENWHEAWHPSTGNRIRYRRSMGIYRTDERSGDDWIDLEIPPPGEVCGEPYDSKPGVFCQAQPGWWHRADVNGCHYTWNTVKREPTPDQVAEDLRRVRGSAANLQRMVDASAVIEQAARDDAAKALAALRAGDTADATEILSDLVESLR